VTDKPGQNQTAEYYYYYGDCHTGYYYDDYYAKESNGTGPGQNQTATPPGTATKVSTSQARISVKPVAPSPECYYCYSNYDTEYYYDDFADDTNESDKPGQA
jgi:hypothetical protein